jgi:sulfur relay protein TusC/DsrF
MALAAANYQFTVNIIFLGMGIFTLTQQQPDIIQTTDTLKVWKSLPLYDVENLFILQNELIDHQLNPEEFLLPIKILSQMEYVDLLHEQDIILNY